MVDNPEVDNTYVCFLRFIEIALKFAVWLNAKNVFVFRVQSLSPKPLTLNAEPYTPDPILHL